MNVMTPTTATKGAIMFIAPRSGWLSQRMPSLYGILTELVTEISSRDSSECPRSIGNRDQVERKFWINSGLYGTHIDIRQHCPRERRNTGLE